MAEMKNKIHFNRKTYAHEPAHTCTITRHAWFWLTPGLAWEC